MAWFRAVAPDFDGFRLVTPAFFANTCGIRVGRTGDFVGGEGVICSLSLPWSGSPGAGALVRAEGRVSSAKAYLSMVCGGVDAVFRGCRDRLPLV